MPTRSWECRFASQRLAFELVVPRSCAICQKSPRAITPKVDRTICSLAAVGIGVKLHMEQRIVRATSVDGLCLARWVVHEWRWICPHTARTTEPSALTWPQPRAPGDDLALGRAAAVGYI